MDDGTIRVSALPQPQVADRSITPQKLSQAYIPATQKGAYNGVATLDNTGRVPLGQMPSGSVLTDASTLNKGVVRLAGDLSGTADAPTVPALNSKYVKPPSGIPETDLSSDVQTKLNTGGAIGDASTTTKGLVKLAGDLGGTADLPTVPGLSSRIPLSQKGANFGVATLDSTGRVPTSQLPAGLEPDATTTRKGIIRLGGDLAGTADAPTVPGKANNNEVMHLMGNETITGVKTFTSSPEVPIPELDNDAASKQYVDGLLASGGVPDATAASKGIIQLTGDLGGTADAPTVPTKINLTEKGASNGVATLDATGKIPSTQLPTMGRIQPFSSSGLLMTEVGTHRLYNDSANPWTILSVRANVGIPSAGSSVIIDINVDGATIFTSQGNRPTVTAGSYTSGKRTNMNITTVPVGSYLTVDVDQVGSTTPGSDLTVQVEVA
jgi:hypothetical protein